MTAVQARHAAPRIYEAANRAALLAYVASTPLSSVQSFGGLSLSFAFAAVFLAIKAAGLLLLGGALRLTAECATIAALLLYLVLAEQFIHGTAVHLTYYVTFLLNCVMLAALVDEFRKAPSLRNGAIAAFCGTTTIMAICVLAGLGSVSQDGRITFLGVNENEMALICLTAFAFVALFLFNSISLRAWPQVVAFGLATTFILVAVRTGTRFTLFALYFELVLLVLLALIRKRSSWISTITAAFWFVLTFASTVSSPVMLDRLDLTVGADRPDSNGALQLGGRLSMWEEAFQAFQKSPIFGLGHTGYENMQLQNNPYFSLPHNFGLEVAAIGGVIGLTFLLALLLQLSMRFHAGWVAARSLDGLVMTVPLLAAGMFLNIISMKVVWFLLAVITTSSVKLNLGESSVSVGDGASQNAGAEVNRT